jgi:hypothetical protein
MTLSHFPSSDKVNIVGCLLTNQIFFRSIMLFVLHFYFFDEKLQLETKSWVKIYKNLTNSNRM